MSREKDNTMGQFVGMLRKSRLLSTQVIVDVVLWIIIGIPVLLMFLMGVPNERGFFCDDKTLMYPYQKDTISDPILMLVGFTVAFIVVLMTELSQRLQRPKNDYTTRNITYIAFVVKGFACYLFTFVINQMFTESLKHSGGRLRPYFFDVCKPDFSRINCTEGYVTDYVCTNTQYSPKIMKSSRLSFPSGHAAFSMAVAVFSVLYLQERFNVKFSRLLRPILQTALILASVLCGVTRIQDNKHHVTDVVAGHVIGGFVAFIIFKILTQQVMRNAAKPKHPKLRSPDMSRVMSTTESQSPVPLLYQDPGTPIFSRDGHQCNGKSLV